MESQHILAIGSSAVFMSLAGCEPEPAAVMQLDRDRIQVIGTGRSEADALRSAIDTANARCAAMGKEAYVLTSDTGYHGVDRDTAFIVGALTNAVAIGTNTPGYSISNSAQSSDWRANLEVRCGPQPS